MGYHYGGHAPFVDRAAVAVSCEDLALLDMARRILPLNRLSGLVSQAVHQDPAYVAATLLEAQRHLTVLRLATYAAELILAEASASLAPAPTDALIGYVSGPVEPTRSGRPVESDDEPPANLVLDPDPESTTDSASRKRSRGARD